MYSNGITFGGQVSPTVVCDSSKVCTDILFANSYNDDIIFTKQFLNI